MRLLHIVETYYTLLIACFDWGWTLRNASRSNGEKCDEGIVNAETS